MEEHILNLIIESFGDSPMDGMKKLELEGWLSEGENWKIYESIHSLWRDTVATGSERFNVKKARKRIEKLAASRPSRKFGYGWICAFVAAACLALALVIPFSRSGESAEPVAEVVMKEVTAANGTHTRVRLPDGSIVTLNAGSTLSYSTVFNIKNRNVSLEGEGYFEVMHNPDLPFVVSASGCRFTVLGTKFNISSYDSDKLASAALIQGSLLVSGADASVLMVPGEITEIDKSDGSLTKFKGDVSEYNSWVKGLLRFDHITLPELVARLSREYNADISLLTNDFNDTGLRISFNLRVPLGDVLESLSSIIPVKVSSEDGSYTITNK